MADLKSWVVSELQSLLQYNVSEDLANCILMIESNRDLEEYLSTLLDITNQSHLNFMKELMQRKQSSNVIGYKKTQLDNYIQSKPDKKKKNNKTLKSETSSKKEDEKESSSGNTTPKTERKKTKTVNLFTSDALDSVLLKGRHVCNCQASKHGLVNNCLKCGRIICEQEGPGPCFFCQNPVSRMANSDKSSSGLDAAVELKDRLLEYDKTSERRTKVIDDESDYFSSNSVWLSKEQKEELKKKEEELQKLKHSRGNAKLLLDFTGRFVVQSDFSNVLNIEDLLVNEVADLLSNSSQLKEHNDLDPNSTCDIQPIYCEDFKFQTGSKWHNNIGRVQDKQVMEMSDQGVCLSMHQPWASLLVAGIKQHEGRSWYTSHRGRLWIASTAKIPTKEDIEEVLCVYRALRGDDTRFPKKFPSGVLLGCVTVADCLAQEDYRDKYPDGESDEPFVFVCEDPIICPIMFPLKGQHKIYKLEQKIHQAAVKCIQKMSKLK